MTLSDTCRFPFERNKEKSKEREKDKKERKKKEKKTILVEHEVPPSGPKDELEQMEKGCIKSIKVSHDGGKRGV